MDLIVDFVRGTAPSGEAERESPAISALLAELGDGQPLQSGRTVEPFGSVQACSLPSHTEP